MSNGDLGGHDVMEGLTGVHPDVHSTATDDQEMQVQIDAFLDALADVAIRVAKRMVDSSGAGEVA